jgi:hypothetical protein
MSLMYEHDVYVTPFLFASLDHTSIYGACGDYVH